MDLAVLLIFIANFYVAICEIARNTQNAPQVTVNKCCEENEIYIGKYCEPVNRTSQWKPLFTSERGESNLQINYTLVTGLPDCGHAQPWSIYHYQNSTDRLQLLPNGVLRHFFDHKVPNEEYELETEYIDGKKSLYHDYGPGKYCLDKKTDGFSSEFALVCAPDNREIWYSTIFLIHNVVNPITHAISMICLLIVAIVYFVMPTLRDLTGNIVTTICVCLIISEAADMIRLLTVFKSHISLLITEAVCYTSLLGAFFWLNTLGYYIWRTFSSRNVFLRITDGKKYCYYSCHAWSCTIIISVLSIFAHFTMDYQDLKPTLTFEQQQEQIGSLAIIIYFVPIAFTVLLDVFFFATTLKTINRMHTYGRIHHKLRHSFRMYLLLMIVMTLCWLFFLASFTKYEALINTHLVVNTCLGPAILYVCVINQRHVPYLMRKTCGYASCCACACCKPEPEVEWGDEMTAMNTANNY